MAFMAWNRLTCVRRDLFASPVSSNASFQSGGVTFGRPWFGLSGVSAAASISASSTASASGSRLGIGGDLPDGHLGLAPLDHFRERLPLYLHNETGNAPAGVVRFLASSDEISGRSPIRRDLRYWVL